MGSSGLPIGTQRLSLAPFATLYLSCVVVHHLVEATGHWLRPLGHVTLFSVSTYICSIIVSHLLKHWILTFLGTIFCLLPPWNLLHQMTADTLDKPLEGYAWWRSNWSYLKNLPPFLPVIVMFSNLTNASCKDDFVYSLKYNFVLFFSATTLYQKSLIINRNKILKATIFQSWRILARLCLRSASETIAVKAVYRIAACRGVPVLLCKDMGRLWVMTSTR